MSLSSEHFDHHLTPTGWVLGTEHLDFCTNKVEIPEDALLTVQEHRKISHWMADEDVWITEMWRSNDTEAVDAAIAKFGPRPHVQPPFTQKRP
ncbi:MAG: hypothetical protein KC652_27475 [Cyanobacteria bacterium HKST-UBA01]|nr:hypothetical protein [Cyanobacteria bacterium HKST-UBA01]